MQRCRVGYTVIYDNNNGLLAAHGGYVVVALGMALCGNFLFCCTVCVGNALRFAALLA